MHKTSGFLALFLLASQAQANIHPYISVGAGAVFPSNDINIDENSSYVLYGPTTAIPSHVSIFQFTDIDWKGELQTGFETNLIVGIHLPHNLRLEGEFLYQNMERDMSGDYVWTERDSTTFHLMYEDPNNPIAATSATTNVYSLLSNLLYDFKNTSHWTPFVGAGFGIAWINSDSTTEANTLHTAGPDIFRLTPTIEYSPELYGTAFAWQAKAGINYAWKENMSFDLVYRLFATSQFEQKAGHIVSNPDTPSKRADFLIPQGDVNGLLDNSVFVNFRYTFK